MGRSFDACLSNFFNKYLSLELNSSKNTIISYKCTFSLLINYLIKEKDFKLNDITFEKINKDVILSFLDYLENNKSNSINTRNQRLGAIKSFYQYSLTLTENIDQIYNIKQILNIKNKKFTKKTQDYLTKEEIKLIFDSINTNKEIGRRNLTILVLLYDSAARADEIVNLCVEDIRYYDNQIILNGKGNKKRVVPIMDETIELLNQYLKDNNINYGKIFKVSEKNNTFIKDIIKSVIKSLSINKNITPHTFRRTRATHLLEAGVSIIYIKDLLGHSSIETTEEYLKINNKYKNEAIKKANELLPKTSLPDWSKDETLLNQLLNL